MLWPARIAFARLRPLNAQSSVRVSIVAVVFGAFLYGDLRLCDRLFGAIARVEVATPFFAIGLLRNLLAMVFLVAMTVLFSSSMTAAIGAFFSDLDLDLYHTAPLSKVRIALARWGKTLAQSAAIVFAFLVPLIVAFGDRYEVDRLFYPAAAGRLLLLLTIPVSLACSVVILLVRFFPVRRVHQIVTTLAVLILTVAVSAFRMSRPERFFREVKTDDVASVLRTIELPSMDLYPSTALADFMAQRANARSTSASDGASLAQVLPIALPAALSFVMFLVIARWAYFLAFVRARESLAPVALGSATATRAIDRLLAPLDAQTRALAAKEIRILVRDVAQWSQLFMMGGLLFIYLYNVRILPLGGDVRATFVAYANVGMAGFVIAAMCLRFAYPTVSTEGKAFWLIESAPISYRRFLLVKVAVYGFPLTFLSLLLTTLANLILSAPMEVWIFTLAGALLLPITLVALGVGSGAFNPDFSIENPLQVGLSLGGFAYMAVSLAYVAAIMLLMARPLVGYVYRRVFGEGSPTVAVLAPVAAAVVLSAGLIVVPLLVAEKRLSRRR